MLPRQGEGTTAEPISSDAFSYVFSDRRRSPISISTVSPGFRLQFWKPSKVFAPHSGTETALGRHRRTKGTAQSSRGKVLAVRKRNGCRFSLV
jgi:hypothetical protein